MKTEDLIEVVDTLVGSIRPRGESNWDAKTLENLKQYCELVDLMVRNIDSVAYDNRFSHEHSIKEHVEYANNFLSKTLGINENP